MDSREVLGGEMSVGVEVATETEIETELIVMGEGAASALMTECNNKEAVLVHSGTTSMDPRPTEIFVEEEGRIELEMVILIEVATSGCDEIENLLSEIMKDSEQEDLQ